MFNVEMHDCLFLGNTKASDGGENNSHRGCKQIEKIPQKKLQRMREVLN